MLVRFIKNWTLPLAMRAGTLGYFLPLFNRNLLSKDIWIITWLTDHS